MRVIGKRLNYTSLVNLKEKSDFTQMIKVFLGNMVSILFDGKTKK